MASLCETISLTPAGCCDPPPAVDTGDITNPPGQDVIVYRGGTFPLFQARLLAALQARLPAWRDLGRRDYGLALLDMWATLADIITFYQERIASEAFLRTAVRRESLIRIAALVDYRPNPGASAATYLAFTVDPPKPGEAPKTITLPAGFRCQTKPAPSAPPLPFETDEAITADASLNLMKVASLQQQSLGFGDRGVILQGTQTGLRLGDRLLVVGQERRGDPTREEWDLRRVSVVTPDAATNTTRVDWQEPLGHVNPHVDPSATPEVYALRLQAWPFGYNTPQYDALKVTTVITVGGQTTTSVSTPSLADWTGKTLDTKPPAPRWLFLDSLYPTISASSASADSWVALVTGESVHLEGKLYAGGGAKLYRVLEVDQTVRSDYTLSSKVTRLTVDRSLDTFPIKGTSVLAQSERLALALVPITTEVAGDTLTLDAKYSALRPGRLIAISGRAAGGEPQAEIGRIKAVNQSGQASVVTLDADLLFAYDPVSVTICGNVAAATHGETVATEILGDGDASQLFQRFTLKQQPLTFVRASGADANRWGTSPELTVRVNDVLYHAREHLLDSGPADRDYVLTADAEDVCALTFGGDGAGDSDGGPEPGGALLPTGRNNVRATYRKGLGVRGNVPSGAVTTVVTSLPGLKGVSNPVAGTGGADHERETDIQVNLPADMRAFDRAVSLEDYDALARTYSGVSKARAYWERRDPTDASGERRLEQPRVRLTVAATDHAPPLQPKFRAALRDFLDARRDPNQPMVIVDFAPVTVDLAVTIEPDPDQLDEVVQGAVAAALSAERNPDGSLGLFAFEALDFGQSVHLSDVYARVQGVPGVRAAVVTRFQHHPRPGESSADIPVVEPHVFVRNNEIVRCDNDPTAPERGALEVTIAAVVTNAP
jgi:hypothetical protein